MADAVEAINVLNFALDAIQERQQVIANNITNENTPGFQAQVVTFEKSLADAVADGGTAMATITPEGLPSGTNGNNVSLPSEMSLMSETGLENQAVSNALTDEFTSLQTAIQG